MFASYVYKIKLLLKDKSLLFWTLLFPMILAVFFNIALRNVYNDTKVVQIPTAVVVSDESIQTFLDIIETEHGLIKQTHFSSLEDAKNALHAKEVDAIISYDGKITLTFTQDSYSSQTTIINNVFESYNTKNALIRKQLGLDPSRVTEAFVDAIVGDIKHVETVADKRTDELFVIHFYTSIAMLCIYASEWGNKSGQYLQANMSAIGIRNNISPTRKGKLLLLDLSAVNTIFLVEFAIHFAFLKYVLAVPFGQATHLILLTALAGGLLTSMLGYMICVTVKGSESSRVNLISLLGVLMSFLSGMMSSQIKALVETYVPLAAKLNPAALITDNFYWIFFETNDSIVYQNILIMLAMTVVFGLIAFRKLRVVTYDHI